MQEPDTARQGGAAFIWKYGAICGVMLGVTLPSLFIADPGLNPNEYARELVTLFDLATRKECVL